MPLGLREQSPIQRIDDRAALSTALFVQAGIARLHAASWREVAFCTWRIPWDKACKQVVESVGDSY